jgi:uncharacterized protein (DUF849 family)
MFLKVCLNGGRHRSDHPAVPITPAELAEAGRAAVDAGAHAIHLHPRSPDGGESMLAADLGPAVAAVRRSCPGVPVGVSTGLWMSGGDVSRRLAALSGWAELDRTHRPDFASVNLSEPGFADVAGTLARAGVGAEAGVWSAADARALGHAGRQPGWVRILVEILDPAPGRGAVNEADQVLAAVRDSGLDLPLLLHGEHDAGWPLVRHAGHLGLPTRIGLEDVIAGPDGEPVRDNAHLVSLARREWRSAADAD